MGALTKITGTQVALLVAIAGFVLIGAGVVIGTTLGYGRAVDDTRLPAPPAPALAARTMVAREERLPSVAETLPVTSTRTPALPTDAFVAVPTAVDEEAGDSSARRSPRIVVVGDLFFAPSTVTIGVGETVEWSFTEGVHTTTGTGSEAWNSGVRQSGSFSYTFGSPGTFTYICTIHPDDMTGTVFVLANGGPTPSPTATATVSPTPTATATPLPTATPTPTPTPQSQLVTVGNLFFAPSTATIAVGETVQWSFTEGVHTTTGTGSKGWDSGVKQSGSFFHTFDSAGTFTYICTIHPDDMTGTVFVLANGGPTPSPTATATATPLPTATLTPTPSPTPPPAPQSQLVTVGDRFFAPSTVTVEEGDTVEWNFIEGVHTTTGTGSEAWDSGARQTGSFSYTFDSPGTFTYICTIHPDDMIGTIIVVASGGIPPSPTPVPTAQADVVVIERAEFDPDTPDLRVEASSTAAEAVLSVLVAATGELIGVLTSEGDGGYEGEFALATDPQSITVTSSLGGSATASVDVK